MVATNYPASVQLEELKQGIEQSSQQDKIFLAAFLRHLVRRDDESHRASLAVRRDEMASGKKIPLDQLQQLNKSLEAGGL